MTQQQRIDLIKRGFTPREVEKMTRPNPLHRVRHFTDRMTGLTESDVISLAKQWGIR